MAGLTGAYLDGSFDVDGHSVSCALSMKSASACTAAYISATASILLSVLLVAMQVRSAPLQPATCKRCLPMPASAVRDGLSILGFATLPLLCSRLLHVPHPLCGCPCSAHLQCATAEGRVGMSFCGPMLSVVGFFWWIAFAASATSAASGAAHWDEPGSSLSQYRTGGAAPACAAAAAAAVEWLNSAGCNGRHRMHAVRRSVPRPAALARCLSLTPSAPAHAGVLAISWACAALFMVSFFVSAAAAAAAARARSKQSEAHASMLRASPSKRFVQPAASPPSSPAKSCKSFNSAYGEPCQ